MTYKKYDLVKATMEAKIDFRHLSAFLRTIYPGCTVPSYDETVITSYDDEAAALQALKSYTADVSTFSGSGTGLMLHITEYLVSEYEANEDGEFMSGSNYSPCSWPEEISIDRSVYKWRSDSETWEEILETEEE